MAARPGLRGVRGLAWRILVVCVVGLGLFVVAGWVNWPGCSHPAYDSCQPQERTWARPPSPVKRSRPSALLQELFRTSHARRCPATLSCSGAVLRLPGRTPPSASAGTTRSFDMHRHPNAHRGPRLRGSRLPLTGLALDEARALLAHYVFTPIPYPGPPLTPQR